MKLKLTRLAAMAAFIITITGAALAAEPTDSQIALFVERENAVRSKNVNAILSTYHSESDIENSGMKNLIQANLNSIELDAIQMKITEVINDGDPALVRVQQLVRGRQEGQPFDKSREYVYLLKDENGKSKVLQEMQSISDDRIDESGSYVSRKGGFALQLPEGWIPTRAPEPMASVIIDGVNGISPDLNASMLVGVVQLPMNLPAGEAAKLVAQTDAASMKAIATSYNIISESPAEMEGMTGWSIISEFELHGEKYKRSQMYFGNDSLVYFMICDLSRLDTMTNEVELRLAFTDAVKSFRLVSTDDNMSVAEQIRSDLGQGSITGNIYSSDKFNCYIAAPEGWSMRTSSSPGTLVEMQLDGGRSMIRLLAEDNIPSTITAEQAFRGRLDQVKEIVQNFQQKPPIQVPHAGTTAWVSEQTYTLEGMGDFTIKEATMLRNGKYYLILCQAISPDDYSKLVTDFDKVIGSFGFTY